MILRLSLHADPMNGNEPTFRYFQREEGVDEYHCHLPHWRQDGVLYFLTFRLGDSIPASVLKAWEEDRRRFLAAHGIDARLTPAQREAQYLQIPDGIRRAYEHEELRSFHVEWDRCHGACLLRRPEAAEILASALRFHHGERLHCGDFVIMPNHVHWLVAPYPEQKLEDLCQSVKRYSAARINEIAGRTGKLWQHENFDHIVRNGRELSGIREYIRDNPVKARLRAGEFVYHKADWLVTGE